MPALPRARRVSREFVGRADGVTAVPFFLNENHAAAAWLKIGSAMRRTEELRRNKTDLPRSQRKTRSEENRKTRENLLAVVYLTCRIREVSENRVERNKQEIRVDRPLAPRRDGRERSQNHKYRSVSNRPKEVSGLQGNGKRKSEGNSKRRG